MPATIDFEQLARDTVEQWSMAGFIERTALQRILNDVAEQLRLVWNARGATDLATVEHQVSTMLGSTVAGPYVKTLDRALRTLDR
jgi:hypothetical protein